MIKSISMTDIPHVDVRAAPSPTKDDIVNFLESGASAAEVDISRFKSAMTAQSSYNLVAKRLGGVTVTRRGNRLFLIRGEHMKQWGYPNGVCV